MAGSDIDCHGRPVVVVTGMGVLTSLGNGKQDNWRELTAGHSGIRRISRFPVQNMRTTIAGTVDFVPVDEVSAQRDFIAVVVGESAGGVDTARPKKRFRHEEVVEQRLRVRSPAREVTRSHPAT